MTPAETKTPMGKCEPRPDCLHCELWKIIHQYCRENPDGCVQDVLDGVVDVIADVLVEKAGTECEELWRRARELMRSRMHARRENRETRQ